MNDITRILCAVEHGDARAAEQLLRLGLDNRPGLVEWNALPFAPMSSSTVMASPVDEDLPHGLGGDVEEVTVIGIGPVADEPEVGLVHQGGGVERVIGAFPRQLRRGQPAQLVIDQRQELLGRPGVAVLDSGKDPGHVVHRHGFRWPPRRRSRPGLERRRP